MHSREEHTYFTSYFSYIAIFIFVVIFTLIQYIGYWVFPINKGYAEVRNIKVNSEKVNLRHELDKKFPLGYIKDENSSEKTVKWSTIFDKNEESLYDMSYSETLHKYVAVGDLGVIRTSNDGVTWSTLPFTTTENLRSVVWNGTYFVTVGYNGTILYSKDTQNWKSAKTNTSDNLKDVAWNGQIFVAVGYKGTIITSTDAVHWEEVTPKDDYEDREVSLSAVLWANNMFVAVGSEGWWGKVLTSVDGVNWVSRMSSFDTSQEVYRIIDVTWDGKQFIAIEQDHSVLTSADGVDWFKVSSSLPAALSGIIYKDKKYFVSSESLAVYYSSDLKTWTKVNVTGNPYHIAEAGSQIFLVGSPGLIHASIDGITWHNRVFSKELKGVAWGGQEGNKKLIAVGGTFSEGIGSDNTIFSSVDGVNWNAIKSPTTGGLTDVIYANGKFTAVGQYGTVLNSSDGVHWTKQTISDVMDLRGITWGNGIYVAFGWETIYTSKNGVDWTESAHGIKGSFTFTDITWASGKFVIVGYTNEDGVILTSKDGLNWSDKKTPAQLYKITYGDGKFVTGSHGAKIFISNNGENWKETADFGKDTELGQNIEAMTWDGNRFWVFGSDPSHEIFTSSNAIDWERRASSHHEIYDAVSDGTQLVAVGQDTTILQRYLDNEPAYTVNILGSETAKIDGKKDVKISLQGMVLDTSGKVIERSSKNLSWEVMWPTKGASVNSVGVLTVTNQITSDVIRVKVKYKGTYGIKEIIVSGDVKKVDPFEGRDSAALQLEEQAALSYLNQIRKQAGFTILTKHPSLTSAAQAHSNYLNMHNEQGHYESNPFKKGYVGYDVGQRADYFEYTRFAVLEGVQHGSGAALLGIDSLLDAPYHRIGLLDPNYSEAGIGFNGGKNANTVINYGVPQNESFKNEREVLYPLPGQSNVKIGWFASESPNPLRFYNLDQVHTGYPISMSYHDEQTVELKIKRASLVNSKGKNIPFYLVDSSKENERKKHVFIIPKAPLVPGETYKVVINATRIMKNGTNQMIDKKWSFTTADRLGIAAVYLKEANDGNKYVISELSNGELENVSTSLKKDGQLYQTSKNGQYTSFKRLKDGFYTLEISHPAFKERQIVTVRMVLNKDIVEIVDKTAPEAPQVNPVSDRDKVVAGKTEAEATVTVQAGSKTYKATAKTDGTYTVNIDMQKAGTVLAVTAKDAAGNISKATSVIVQDKTAPVAPQVNPVSDRDKIVTGKTEAEATVTVQAGSKTYKATAKTDGVYAVTIAVQKAGTVLTVTVTDKAGNVSKATSVIVQDKTAPGAPKVNAVNSRDKVVTGRAEAGSTVTIKAGSKTYRGTVKTDGTYKVGIDTQRTGTVLTISATDKAGNVSAITRVTVGK